MFFVFFILILDSAIGTKIHRTKLNFNSGKRNYVYRNVESLPESDFVDNSECSTRGNYYHVKLAKRFTKFNTKEEFSSQVVENQEWKYSACSGSLESGCDFDLSESMENNCPKECGRQGYNGYRIVRTRPTITEQDYTAYRKKRQSHWCRCTMAQHDSPFSIRTRCKTEKPSSPMRNIEKKRFYCPTGREHAILSGGRGVVVCAECPIGRFQDQKNFIDLLDATKSNKHGWGKDNTYLSDFWASYVHVDLCKACPEGKYQDETGQTTCKECPGGKTTKSQATVKRIDCSIEMICGSGGEMERHTLSDIQTRILRADSRKKTAYIVDANTALTEIYKYKYENRHWKDGYLNEVQIPTWYDPTKTSTNDDDIHWRRNAHKHGTKYMVSEHNTCEQCQPGTYAEMDPLEYDMGTALGAIIQHWGRQWNFVQNVRLYTSKSFSSGTACYLSVERRCLRFGRGIGYNCHHANTKEYCKETKIICKQCPFGKTGNGWHCEDAFDECAVDEITVINDAGSAQCQKCPAGTFTFPVDNNWIVPTLSNTLDTPVDVKYLNYSLTTASPMDYASWPSANKDERYLDWLNVYDYMDSSSIDTTYVRWLKRTPQSGLEHYYLAWLKSETNVINHAEYSKLPSTMCFGCPNGKTNNDGGNGLDSCVNSNTC